MAKRFRKHKPTVRDGSVALHDHLITVAATARERYGPEMDFAAIVQILDDREIVRYPVSLAFDDAPLQTGEFAFPEPIGCHPSEGYTLFIHPYLEGNLEALPLLIGYQLVRINYGDVASHEEAEVFGAALCEMDRDAYYEQICRIADSIPVSAET
ncbi:MAG: hypothetical protein DHS20C16_32740 [Phycisphaerae bacterium]|nr:MAG: hypothetical protein DHS20C16_32740 [Phycisphaerae bacterium]